MDHDFLTSALKTAYAADCSVERPLAQGAKQIFLVESDARPGGWVVRALTVDADDYHTSAYLASAQILTHLEQQNYPTERLIHTANGETTALVDGWRLMVTTYLGLPLAPWQGESSGADRDDLAGDGHDREGQSRILPADFFELGARLGRLHTLPTEANDSALPEAITLPKRDLVWVAGYLAAQAEKIPPHLQDEYQSLLSQVRSTDTCEGLPIALLHSDAHPGNAVRRPDESSGGNIVLVDWEGAGLGPAIVDLGNLLGNCVDGAFQPDRDAVRAVINGYCTHRIPSAAEVIRLPDATRFTTLVRLAGYFGQWAGGELADDERVYGTTHREAQTKLNAADHIAAEATILIERKSKS